MNKKGFIASALPDLYSYIVFMLVILIFFILFKGAKILEVGGVATEGIPAEAEEKANLDLLIRDFLRSPVDVDGNTITYAEAFALYFEKAETNEKAKYQEFVEKGTVEFLNSMQYCYTVPKHEYIRGYRIEIVDKVERWTSLDLDFESDRYWHRWTAGEYEYPIPTPSKTNLHLNLKLSYQQKKEGELCPGRRI